MATDVKITPQNKEDAERERENQLIGNINCCSSLHARKCKTRKKKERDTIKNRKVHGQ